MKTILKYILCISFAGLMAACQSDFDPKRAGGKHTTFEDGVTISLLFPEMQSTATRAIGPNAPRLTNLDLFIFVFDGPILSQTLRIDRDQTEELETAISQNGISFKAYLPQTENNAVLHIVAIDDSDRSFSKQVDAASFGIEDSIMPLFYVENQQDAYWARIDLGCQIISTIKDEEGNTVREGTETEVHTQFAHPIPLIRNFAEITINSKANNFTILGWCIVNALNEGSVVPWFSPEGSSDITYPVYAEWSDNDQKNVPKNYEDLAAAGYNGVSQTGASRLSANDGLTGFFRSEDIVAMTTPGVGDDWGTGPKYLYERHQVSVNPLYLIIYGSVKGISGVAEGSNYYYKVALGHTDASDVPNYGTGLFTEYNVLRNIRYTVNINSVTGVGSDTPAAAAAAPAFNNLSGDVVTRNLLSISDGVDMLYVSGLTYVITTDEQADKGFDFRYRYIVGITTSKEETNSLVVWNDPKVGIKSGAAIKSFKENPEYTNPSNKTKWGEIHITTEHPTDALKQQTFTVYSRPGGPQSDPTVTMGLSRTVTVIVRRPWNFENVQTYPGLWEDDTKYPDYNPDEPGGPGYPDEGSHFVGAEKDAPLTIFFELPSGLPEALFPLDFTIESDRQNIENAAIGNALVTTGPSLFEGVSDNRIKYVKTINWQDYAPDGTESTPQSRICRARFVTNTALTNLPDDETVTTVIVHNPYFNNATDKFKRDQNKTVPDPS